MTSLGFTSQAAAFIMFRSYSEQWKIQREVALEAKGWIVVFLECTGAAGQWETSDINHDNPIYTPWFMSADSKWRKIIYTEKGCSSDKHMFISVSFF